MLSIDTNGLLKPKAAPDDPSQPHLVAVACDLLRSNAEPLSPPRSFCELVRAENWRQSEGASRVHGITSSRAGREGVPEALALWAVVSKSQEATEVIAYQGTFARDVIQSLLLRQKHGQRDQWIASWQRPGLSFNDLGQACTAFCKLPGNGEDGQYRRPKIEEAYASLCPHEGPFNTGPNDCAQKLAMTKAIFRALIAKDAIERAVA